MIKTAIIGASGFIGSHLIKKYKSKYPDCIGTSFSSDVTNLLKFDLRNPNIKPLISFNNYKSYIYIPNKLERHFINIIKWNKYFIFLYFNL